MTLPSSGTLTILDIVGEFGGVASHGLQEYYKDGGLVPSSRTELVIGSYTEPVKDSYTSWSTHTDDLQLKIRWPYTTSYHSDISDRFVDTYLKGNYRYARSGGAVIEGSWYEYAVKRRLEENQTVSINTGVPTTGEISIYDFYGAEAA